jgi:hypothetical protein
VCCKSLRNVAAAAAGAGAADAEALAPLSATVDGPSPLETRILSCFSQYRCIVINTPAQIISHYYNDNNLHIINKHTHPPCGFRKSIIEIIRYISVWHSPRVFV